MYKLLSLLSGVYSVGKNYNESHYAFHVAVKTIKCLDLMRQAMNFGSFEENKEMHYQFALLLVRYNAAIDLL